MKAGWLTKTIGELCVIKPPKSEARAALTPSDLVSFVPMEDLPSGRKFLSPSRDRALSEVIGGYTYFADGDVLLAKITPCFENGKLGVAANLTNGIGFGSSEYLVLRPDSTLSSEWLYYYLARESFRVEGVSRMSGAVGHKRVPHEFVARYQIPVPPLAEQKRIVASLDQALEAIDAAKANAEKAELNANGLFGSVLHESIDRLRQESSIVSVAELVRQGVLVKPQDGNHGEMHPTRAEYVSQGVPFVMAADLQAGSVNTVTCRFISKTRASNLRIGFAKNGDVLLSHKGTIGRVAVLETDLDYVMLTPQVTYYRVLDSTRLLSRYLYFYFQSEPFQGALAQIAGAGSTRAYIGITRQLDLEVLVPPLSKQAELVDRLTILEPVCAALSDNYRDELEQTKLLRQALLAATFEGNSRAAA